MTQATPLWQLTVGEFTELLRQNIRPAEAAPVKPKPDTGDKYVYGIDGIARLLGCSRCRIHEYGKQGWIEPSITQNGRKIVCDGKLAMELFGKRTRKTQKR
jgi:hypothetical protein